MTGTKLQAYIKSSVEAFQENCPLSYRLLDAHGVAYTGTPNPDALQNQECYCNAFELAMMEGYTYVEGVALSRNLPVPLWHAWCVDAEGKVHDPTWEDGREYFGVAFDQDWLEEHVYKTGYYGVFESLYLIKFGGIQEVMTYLASGLCAINCTGVQNAYN